MLYTIRQQVLLFCYNKAQKNIEFFFDVPNILSFKMLKLKSIRGFSSLAFSQPKLLQKGRTPKVMRRQNLRHPNCRFFLLANTTKDKA